MTESSLKAAELADIQADILQLEDDSSLFERVNFSARINAIDFIEFHILDRINSLLPCDDFSSRLLTMQDRANGLIARLNEINSNFFDAVRKDIAAGKLRGTAFKKLIAQHVDLEKLLKDEEGYDELDVFINGLFPDIIPQQTKELEAQMVSYQKTPARVVLEIADKLFFTHDDVFYDLGSGLGHVGILLNLLTGVSTKGIEYEPAFCDYSRKCAKELNLGNVHFINANVRDTDLSDGTVFFMYTPFKDDMLQQVLENLSVLSQSRPIKIITYGPCSAQVAKHAWLQQVERTGINFYEPAFFTSQ